MSGIDLSSNNPDVAGLIDTYAPDHVVVRMYLPGEKPPQDWSIATVATALAAGKTVSPYIWCYRSFRAGESVRQGLDLARRAGLTPKVLWLDCETYTERDEATGELVVKDPGPDVGWLRAAVAACRAEGLKPGIYTGGWYWKDPVYMGNTSAFADCWLWTAEPGEPTLDGVALYGGWTRAMARQYATDGVDQDVFDSTVV